MEKKKMFKNDRPIYIVGRAEVVRLDDVYKDVYTYQVSNERNNYSDQELINICTPIAETKIVILFLLIIDY